MSRDAVHCDCNNNYISGVGVNKNLFIILAADLDKAEANYEKAKQELDTTLNELNEM